MYYNAYVVLISQWLGRVTPIYVELLPVLICSGHDCFSSWRYKKSRAKIGFCRGSSPKANWPSPERLTMLPSRVWWKTFPLPSCLPFLSVLAHFTRNNSGLPSVLGPSERLAPRGKSTYLGPSSEGPRQMSIADVDTYSSWMQNPLQPRPPQSKERLFYAKSKGYRESDFNPNCQESSTYPSRALTELMTLHRFLSPHREALMMTFIWWNWLSCCKRLQMLQFDLTYEPIEIEGIET